MDKVIRILAIIGSLPLAFVGLRWIVDPSGAAEGLQMIYMEGAARNSQIGDLTAFFVGMSGFALYGILKQKADFIYAATILLGGTAVWRVLAGVVHDAPTIWSFVAIEVVTSAIWVAHARTLKS